MTGQAGGTIGGTSSTERALRIALDAACKEGFRTRMFGGADMARVVNVRKTSSGMHEPGLVLYRNGRLTPEAIYRTAGDDREAALALLVANGYLL